MKKNYFYAAVLALWCGTAMGQLNNFQGVNFGNMPNPVPSLAPLASFNDNPPSLASGVPEISMPLLSLPGYGSGVGLQLSYDRAGSGETVGEMGAGWFMPKGGAISRKINGLLDEIHQDLNSPDYEKNVFDDEYYYSVPGLSGKFKIERNIQQNSFSLIDLSPLNHVKIAYTRKNNVATLIVDSFTITDDQGNTYHFNDSSIAALLSSNDIGEISSTEFNSAFYLSSIKNASGVEVASFTYKKEAKYLDDKTTLFYKTCQLEKISTAFGNIEMVYDYDEALEKTKNEPYSIKKIILNNKYAKTAEYAFEYSYPFPSGSVESTSKIRQLDKIKKMDGQTVLEETSFLYNPLSSNSLGSLNCGGTQIIKPYGMLNKIIFPTKGATEYVYETGEVYKDRNSAAYLESISGDLIDMCIQYTQQYPLQNFDTTQSLTYTFTIPGDPTKKKTLWFDFAIEYNLIPGPIDPNTGFPTIPPPIKENQKMSYTLKRGNETIFANTKVSGKKFYNYPGQYTVTITIPYVHGGSGNFSYTELMYKPGPYRNSSPAGMRIKSINRYNDVSSTMPIQSMSYSYNKLNSTDTSGEMQSGEVIYRNVKVSEDSGKGYSQYYFKLPSEYPSYSYVYNGNTVPLRPYHNLVKSGVLEKKEIYSDSNQLLAKDEYNYTFTEVDNSVYEIGDTKTYSKPAFTSQTKTSSVAYPSGTASSFLQSSGENNVRADNFKPSSSKSIAPDGTVTETFYKYAQDKNHTRLLEANMTGVLLESEVKENGKTIGKSETKFDNGSHLYPSSVIVYDRQTQAPVTTSTLDVYDSKGNLVQATGKNGIPSTTVWGYNQKLPIAVIAGASYAQVASLSSVTAAIAASDADNDNPANEPALLQALDTLRKDPALKDFSITTSTYDPLVGITNSISANGIRTTNAYDTAGRLIKVKDSDGKTLTENQYNYKH
ncbi:RHS repeat protein [Chryseobacterium indologenes]|uniref:RHS repeat protein n=1 Tax=Chryseobacterium indologenes TaxID=253 RepID=UPI00162836D0|nr:RHS repeat protein [Chryseobacterium indologenes]MBF6643073.1 RHS repeat protein [Chryseobacterium indologenes]MBU3049397.1 hypothetical protein [Chryseobacterium indologenes]QQQ73047.1 RHS repeat protein [Chryseobacterium indologenes]